MSGEPQRRAPKPFAGHDRGQQRDGNSQFDKIHGAEPDGVAQRQERPKQVKRHELPTAVLNWGCQGLAVMIVQCPELRLGSSSDYVREDQRRMAVAARYYDWQARLVRREIGPRVIEAGCGIGNLTARLLDREALIAVDVDHDAIRQLE